MSDTYPAPSRDTVHLAEALATSISVHFPQAKVDASFTWGTTVMVRALFPNNWGLSIIQGPHTYGGAKGFFEVATLDPSGDLWAPAEADDTVRGWLSVAEVYDELVQVRAYGVLHTIRWRWGKAIAEIRLAYKKWKEARP